MGNVVEIKACYLSNEVLDRLRRLREKGINLTELFSKFIMSLEV